MKKIGLIGGIGPESTLDYYQRIISAFHELPEGSDYPEIVVYSANLSALLRLLQANAWDELEGWLIDKVRVLEQAGAELIAICSNTPHAIFDTVSAAAKVPMLSIVEETCRHARERGFKKLGLLGTEFTMGSDFYKKPFTEAGMQVRVPEADDRALIQERLFSEIERGVIKDRTRDELLAVVRRMHEAHGIEALILGCTELPLILDADAFGIPFLNTTAIHADSIVRACLG